MELVSAIHQLADLTAILYAAVPCLFVLTVAFRMAFSH